MISINVLLMVSRIKYFFIEIFVLIVYRSVNKVFFYNKCTKVSIS